MCIIYISLCVSFVFVNLANFSLVWISLGTLVYCFFLMVEVTPTGKIYYISSSSYGLTTLVDSYVAELCDHFLFSTVMIGKISIYVRIWKCSILKSYNFRSKLIKRFPFYK